MRLNNREKMLVLTLGIFLILILYYKYIIKPQSAAAETVYSQVDSKRNELAKLKQDISSEGKIYVELLKLEDKINNDSKKYFTKITQEDIILLIDELVKDTKLKIISVSFEEPTIEDISKSQEENKDDKNKTDEKGTSIELGVHSVNLNYEGNYYSFLDFLKKVSENEKKIIVKQINTSKKDESGYLTGSVVLDFYDLGNLINDSEVLYAWEPNLGSVVGDPFLEFNDYIKAKEEKVEESKQQIESSVDSSQNTSIIKGSSSTSSGGKAEPEFQGTTIFGFEDKKSLFFVGNAKQMYGELNLDKSKSVEGKYSLNFKYDFLEKRKNNIGNISFDNNIVIKEQPHSLALSVYPLDKTKCSLGVIIRDDKGKEYKLPITEDLNWTGWKTLNLELPIEINYPAVVERVYIESVDYYEKLSGNILIDNLELLYSK